MNGSTRNDPVGRVDLSVNWRGSFAATASTICTGEGRVPEPRRRCACGDPTAASVRFSDRATASSGVQFHSRWWAGDNPVGVDSRLWTGYHAGAPGNLVPAENRVRAGQAACWYSWRVPPRRSRRHMSRWAMASGSVIGGGRGCSGRASAMPWWGRVRTAGPLGPPSPSAGLGRQGPSLADGHRGARRAPAPGGTLRTFLAQRTWRPRRPAALPRHRRLIQPLRGQRHPQQRRGDHLSCKTPGRTGR